MTDSRSFAVPDNFDIERLGHELVAWLNKVKHLDARGMLLQDGFLVQTQRRGNLRDWVGIDETLQVKLAHRSGTLEVSMQATQGIDRFKQNFPDNVLFSPLAVPAAVGAWLQQKLPEAIFDWIKTHRDDTPAQLFPARAKTAEEMDAAATITQRRASDSQTPVDWKAAEQQLRATGRYFQKGGVVEEELLIRQLRSQEIVLAWLMIASVTHLPDESMFKPRVTWHYLLTTDRSALIGYSNEGSPLVYELPAEPLQLSGSLMRYTVTVQQLVWKTLFSNDELYEEIALVPAGDRHSRMREMSRLNWLHREQDAGSARISRWLLRHLTAESSNPWDCLSSAYVEQGADYEDSQAQVLDSKTAKEAFATCLGKLLKLENGADLLLQWTRRWGLSTTHQMAMVQMALDLKPAEKSAVLALPLHRQVTDSVTKRIKDPTRQTIVALSFAKHLLQAGKHAEALTVLEKQLAELPDASLMDLLPPKDADLTSGNNRIIRCRILELLVEARGDPGAPDVSTVAELARLQPLVRSRVKDLIELSSGSLKNRAQDVYKLLTADGAGPGSPEAVISSRIHSLPKRLLVNDLPHPAARRGGAFDWLEGWLGKTPGPDYSALKSYVERVTAARHPQAMQALTDAAIAFGIKTMEAYISRGDKEVGIRIYEGSPPFLLIGGAHLDEQSEFYLKEAELRFAMAGEAAHLHYHHTRLTSNELWTGVFRKGTQFLGIFGSLAGPLGYLGEALQNIEALKNSEVIFREAEAVTGGAKQAVDLVGYAKDVQQLAASGKEKPEPEQQTLSEDNGKLLAAFRVMQLTADRAGLVLCGDIRAAVRAIFLTSRQYQVELPRVEQHGLAEMLDRRNTEGEVINQDLAVRLAALCSFYLSNNYLRLQHALA